MKKEPASELLRVRKTTKARLRRKGKQGDTFDDIINNLMKR